PAELVVGPVLGSRLCVPQSPRDVGQDPGVRRPGLLAVPEADVAGEVPPLAERDRRGRQAALRARAASTPCGRQPERKPGRAAVAAGYAAFGGVTPSGASAGGALGLAETGGLASLGTGRAVTVTPRFTSVSR